MVALAVWEMTGLPVLADIEAPLELEMSLLVVVNKAGDGVVVSASEHAGGSIFLLDYTGHSVSIKSHTFRIAHAGLLKRCGNLNSHRLV